MSFDERLKRLEAAADAACPAPARVVDLDRLFRKLEQLGLAEWNEEKRFWHPTDPALLKRLIAERKARL